MGPQKKTALSDTPISIVAGGIFVFMTIIAWISQGIWCALTVLVISVLLVVKLIKPAELNNRQQRRSAQFVQASPPSPIVRPVHRPAQKPEPEPDYYEPPPAARKAKTPAKQRVLDTVRFVYRDADGNTTERTVDMTTGIRGEHFHAWCHMRREERTFHFDRIQSGEVIRVTTGEVIAFAEWRKQLRAMRRTPKTN
jgi:hypothetical protein